MSAYNVPLQAPIRLTLENFRNYTNLDLQAAKINIITGENGAGKTNLLEALSLLAPGRGLRGAPLDDIIHHKDGKKKTHWAIRAQIRTDLGMIPLDIRYGATHTAITETRPASRRIHIDSKKQKSTSALGHYIRLYWLTPAMDRLFTATASERRRFLDRLTLGFHPDHSIYTQKFDRLMRERNRILLHTPIDTTWIGGVEKQMAQNGITIAAARKATLHAISTFLEQIRMTHAEIGFPYCHVHLDCAIDHLLDNHSALETEDIYAERLSASRHEDRQAGRTLHGPHRADLITHHGTKHMPAQHCSTGEQKALLTTIILAGLRAARAKYGYAPILLLDEITAHFDAKRRHMLLEHLADLNAQIWMTGTAASLFASLDKKAQFLYIENDRVKL